MLPEETFANIFTPSTSSLPPDASQQQRAEKYTYSYNPFLRHKENFQHQKYHRKRDNRERTRPPFPSPSRLAASPEPEQPGSQETIRATTSPPPLNLAFNEGCAMCSYDKSVAPRETNTMHSQMPKQMGGPGVRMMGGPMMNQPRMGYNPHFPPHMQGANSFQQLNNFVNGPIPSMYGGMPPQGHMGGNMMPMMGGPNYGNPNAGPMMYGGPQGNMMGNMVPPGYGGDPNNMVHGMQQGNYMNQYGGMPNGGMA